jgi:hypothetical protein
MDSLQYNKSNSEHLDRYLREAFVHKETDFETKRKLLCKCHLCSFPFQPYDIFSSGYVE